MGFSPSNADQLDSWMVHAFQKNLPPQFHLVVGAPGALSRPDMGTEPRHPAARHPHGHEEFPTLLHFAAKYGLEKLAWQLLECPGAEAACELRNLGDLTPAEIAEHAGHTKLASALKGYLVSEYIFGYFYSAYQLVIDIIIISLISRNNVLFFFSYSKCQNSPTCIVN